MTSLAGCNLVLVAAMTHQRVIGRAGKIPWDIPEDLRLFRELTWGGSLIMGRKTWESLQGPLPGRVNLVVSRTLHSSPGIEVCRSVGAALQRSRKLGGPTYVIGGAEVYSQTMALADCMMISWVDVEVEGDRFFPSFEPAEWEEFSRQTYPEFSRVFYRRKTCRLT